MEKLPLHSCLCLDAPRILAFRSAPFLDRKIKGRREARIPYLEADRFTCFADGYPRPSVFIRLNGKNLTGVNDIKRHGNTVSSIFTSWTATSRKTQEFCCYAYSKEGRAKKECITAFVEGIPLYIGTNEACLLTFCCSAQHIILWRRERQTRLPCRNECYASMQGSGNIRSNISHHFQPTERGRCKF